MSHQASATAGYLTPMLHVASIERSVSFYELLGFKTVDTDRCEPMGWARMHCEGGAVMFLRAEETFSTQQVPVLFCLYAQDLPRLRERLVAAGVEVPPISHPDYMPSGKINVSDPDGYRIEVCHWGKREHDEWLKRIGADQ